MENPIARRGTTGSAGFMNWHINWAIPPFQPPKKELKSAFPACSISDSFYFFFKILGT
jgi:hypothetical protein